MQEPTNEQNPGQLASRTGVFHSLLMLLSNDYRDKYLLGTLLGNFEISSPPFTRPIFYRHRKLRAPANVLFEVSSHGLLRFSTLDLEPTIHPSSFLHIDAGRHVYHLDLFNGEIERSPSGPGRRSGYNFFETMLAPQRTIKWLQTQNSSPTSKVVAEGCLTGESAVHFWEVIRLWQLMRTQNPDQVNLIAYPCARMTKDLP
jgi:hypothetical protein